MGKYSLVVRKAGSHSKGQGSNFSFGIPFLDFDKKHNFVNLSIVRGFYIGSLYDLG